MAFAATLRGHLLTLPLWCLRIALGTIGGTKAIALAWVLDAALVALHWRANRQIEAARPHENLARAGALTRALYFPAVLAMVLLVGDLIELLRQALVR